MNGAASRSTSGSRCLARSPAVATQSAKPGPRLVHVSSARTPRWPPSATAGRSSRHRRPGRAPPAPRSAGVQSTTCRNAACATRSRARWRSVMPSDRQQDLGPGATPARCSRRTASAGTGPAPRRPRRRAARCPGGSARASRWSSYVGPDVLDELVGERCVPPQSGEPLRVPGPGGRPGPRPPPAPRRPGPARSAASGRPRRRPYGRPPRGGTPPGLPTMRWVSAAPRPASARADGRWKGPGEDGQPAQHVASVGLEPGLRSRRWCDAGTAGGRRGRPRRTPGRAGARPRPSRSPHGHGAGPAGHQLEGQRQPVDPPGDLGSSTVQVVGGPGGGRGAAVGEPLAEQAGRRPAPAAVTRAAPARRRRTAAPARSPTSRTPGQPARMARASSAAGREHPLGLVHEHGHVAGPQCPHEPRHASRRRRAARRW